MPSNVIVTPGSPIITGSAVSDAIFQDQVASIQKGMAAKGIGVSGVRVTASSPSGGIPMQSALLQLIAQQIQTPGSKSLTANLKPWNAKVLGPPQIAFKYIVDGCYARAEEMDLIYFQQALNNMKAFVIGSLKASNELFKNGVTWWYHVAPPIITNTGTTSNPNYELLISDPAVRPSNPLMTLPDWVAAINTPGSPVSIELTDRAQYFPMNGGDPSTQPFNANLKPAHDTLVKYQGLLLQIEAGKSGPTPFANVPAHDVTGVPHAVEPNGDVKFRESPRVFKAGREHLRILNDALQNGKPVKLSAHHGTGNVLNVSRLVPSS
jgi:hypothetical protein